MKKQLINAITEINNGATITGIDKMNEERLTKELKLLLVDFEKPTDFKGFTAETIETIKTAKLDKWLPVKVLTANERIEAKAAKETAKKNAALLAKSVSKIDCLYHVIDSISGNAGLTTKEIIEETEKLYKTEKPDNSSGAKSLYNYVLSAVCRYGVLVKIDGKFYNNVSANVGP
jgi:hypothetical protein